MLEEVLGVRLSLALVESGQSDGGDLQQRDDDDKEAVRGQQDPRLFDGAAVAQERHQEDEGAGSDQNVGALFNYCRFC